MREVADRTPTFPHLPAPCRTLRTRLSNPDRHHRRVVERFAAAAERLEAALDVLEDVVRRVDVRREKELLEPVRSEHVTGFVLHFDAAVGVEIQQVSRLELRLPLAIPMSGQQPDGQARRSEEIESTALTKGELRI